jgi:hydroxymethylbilane synthase
MAGLHRLGIAATHTVAFDAQTVVPAVGQGALAIETLATSDWLAGELRAAIDHTATHLCVHAERAALRALHAGCSAPLGIHATLDGETMAIDGAYGTPDGRIHRERVTGAVRDRDDARKLGETIAARLAREVNA